MSLLFIQKRAIRAGAQTSLARMVRSEPLRAFSPAALIGAGGWLADDLRSQNVPCTVIDFPSPRSLRSRLLGFENFAHRAMAALDHAGVREVRGIIANDHQECPLALALARRLGGVPVLGILRTPSMTERDFRKYRCESCGGIMGEGAELRDRIRRWTAKSVGLFEEGFAEDEFMPPKPWPQACPRRILVIGSEAPRKGFTDFITALDAMESLLPEFPGFECDFTGTQPEAMPCAPAAGRRSVFRFLGRVQGFANLVRQYDLAVHPSRAETFGMAPVEALLAGTPTLMSVAGVVASLSLPVAWTFLPGDAGALTDRMIDLWRNWSNHRLDLAAVQATVRGAYHINHTSGFVRQELAALGVT